MRKFFGPTGSVSRVTVESRALESNMLGDPTARAVDVYVAPVKLDGRHIRPANLREAIRLRGPTIELPFSFGI